MPCTPTGARKRAREYNFIPDAKNALQRLAGALFLCTKGGEDMTDLVETMRNSQDAIAGQQE